MPGILDENYGVAEERRNRLIKRIVIWGLVVIVAATVGYFSLRTWSQQRVMSHFLDDLKQQKYQAAYALWGCTQDTPCKYYPPEKFTQDWGPSSPYANPSELKIEHVDFCNDGVVFDLSYPKSDDLGLWVNRSTNAISFAPWPRCPGRHLQLGQFFHSLFS